jgi:predicted O-methyltransferase YrrM
MSQRTWTAVDEYLDGLLVGQDEALEAALQASREAGLPPINVSPTQGKLLNLLARAIGARAILEVGTLGGYSTIWMARALPPDGRLVTLEIDDRHAEVARANLARAGLAQRVEVRLGRALDSLQRLADEGAGPFGLVFIDADKPNISEYFGWAVRLTRPGSLIVVDNVVRDGAVIDARSRDASVQGVRRLNELMSSEPRVSATVIQTVGAKGYDGFALALVIEQN